MLTDTKTIFASPVMNNEMYWFQRELHECLYDFDTEGWEWYCPDSWMPYCTLALTNEDEEDIFFKASDLILREFEKISGKLYWVSKNKFSCGRNFYSWIKRNQKEIVNFAILEHSGTMKVPVGAFKRRNSLAQVR